MKALHVFTKYVSVFSPQRSPTGPSNVYGLCSLRGKKLIFVHNIALFRRGVPVSISEHCVWDLWWTQRHWDMLPSEYFRFPPSISFLQCSILKLFCTILVTEGPTGETLEPWEQWTRSYFHFCQFCKRLKCEKC